MDKYNPIRCAQIITSHGVGSLIIAKGGDSFVVAGLDAFYEPGSRSTTVDESEFIISEPRLQERLDVSHFRLPPDYRENRAGVIVKNVDLKLPVLRFPQWNVCPRCNKMEHLPLTKKDKPICFFCFNSGGVIVRLAQIPIIALCPFGHMQDFPWAGWAHKQHHPTCRGTLSYLRSGGSTLAAQKITCECGASRSLHGIDRAWYAETYLTDNLSRKEGFYLCRGHRPWLGQTTDEPCDQHLRGNLRGAGNVHFSQSVSAIYLPMKKGNPKAELLGFLGKDEISGQICSLKSLGHKSIGEFLQIFYRKFLGAYSIAEIAAALCEVEAAQNATAAAARQQSEAAEQPGASPAQNAAVADEDDFRFAEFEVLRESQDNDLLLTRCLELGTTYPLLAQNFSRLVLVHRMRETRVSTGFSRIFSSNVLPLKERKEMMRRSSSSTAAGVVEATAAAENDSFGFGEKNDWLPAMTVFGEGIYLEINEEKLKAWENLNAVSLEKRLLPLNAAYQKARRGEGRSRQMLTARFVLAHTIAHLLIRQLTFECGYSASALRERLYVSGRESTRMCGILIYTADGDSEGTLGGLVRMGQPDFLEDVLRQAFDNAQWCSSDPVCSELGSRGQGPGSCNLAACHSCGLLPETSCEEFNRFLDRTIVNEFVQSG